MDQQHFGSDLWPSALDKFTRATGFSVELFAGDGSMVVRSTHLDPLATLFRESGVEPGLFAACARRCLDQAKDRRAITLTGAHGLTVVGTALALDGEIVGAAVAGYALADFTQVRAVQRWAASIGVPFDRLWNVARRQAPVPERRLLLHGELLQVLGDALLRENHRTRQYQDTVVELRAAAAAKDEFIAVVSHELRTPLAPILTWANVLRNSPSPEHLRSAVESIERNVLRESRIIEDLLDVNRIVHGGFSLTRGVHLLPALVRAAFEAVLQDAQKKAVRLNLVGEGELLYVDGDAGRLEQIFRNVLSNAVKFTPAGGSVLVTLRREGNDAVVLTRDTGVGIDPEFLPLVFDMFRQQDQGTKRVHGGLGIGLALVKRLIELHQGAVTVVSEGMACGTEVMLRIPLSTRPTETKADAVLMTPQPSLKGLSILVVEDSEDTRDAIRSLLELLGAAVSVACDGREGLDLARATEPDLVLCDLRMPRMDGFEFIRELYDEPTPARRPPVIALSGLVSEGDSQRIRAAGFEAHLKKPCDGISVVAAVRTALSH